MTPGQKAAKTKGPIEQRRAGQMAAWTKANPTRPRSENPFLNPAIKPRKQKDSPEK